MRFALGVQYKGAAYKGWQTQHALPSVQKKLEEALSKVANHPIEVLCAGRTDAGVHALGQVVHFDTKSTRKNDAWILGTNTYLPNDIAVQWVKPVTDTFHARFSALSRTYRYFIFNHPRRSAIFDDVSTWIAHPLNSEKMHVAAQYLIGEKDFSSFRSSECESKTAMRYLSSISVTKQNSLIQIEITANAFLHHMVRNIVGTLLPIGLNEKPVEWLLEVILAKDRRLAGRTAPPNGLFLFQVNYPLVDGIPDTGSGGFFI